MVHAVFKPNFLRKKAKPRQGGFTLVELMVTVAILGVLASIAIPQYVRHQRKAQQTEAKIRLASIYGLEKAFHSEYGAYIASFDAIGFSSDGYKRRYDSRISGNCAVGGLPTGYSGATTTSCIAAVNSPYALTNTYTSIANCTLWASANYVADSQGFVSFEVGNLGTAYDDIWTITELKTLRNCTQGF